MPCGWDAVRCGQMLRVECTDGPRTVADCTTTSGNRPFDQRNALRR